MLAYSTQLNLFSFAKEQSAPTPEWGTFKDSLRAPVHSWFTYPAGFSYKAVAASLRQHGIAAGQTVYDPFMGTGTTNLTAKQWGLNSYGVEAHPFVFRVARTKLNWDVVRPDVSRALAQIAARVRLERAPTHEARERLLAAEFPELALKCYETKTLWDLRNIRDAIREGNFAPPLTDFLVVGLTNILRQVSSAHTGWPYIAPKKQKTTSLGKDAWIEFSRQISGMAQDLEQAKDEAHAEYAQTAHRIFNADSRATAALMPNECADHVFTSPPYLNNFDYADRTRLELYFFGEAKTWGDITRDVRTRLITSATTQIARDDPRYQLVPELRAARPDVFVFLEQAVNQLSELRLTKGGKKSYDHLVAGYFNDMLRVLADTFRVLRPHTKAVFVLGDSAPYGVHIPTDELIGKIGVGVGFADYNIEILRDRGGKWKDNPQRHNVMLRESIVTLSKGS
jgi:DNA modification methylase